jgi:hypothetical protein
MSRLWLGFVVWPVGRLRSRASALGYHVSKRLAGQDKNLRRQPTREAHISGHLGQRCIDKLFKVHLFVLNVVQRLPRSQTRFAVS